MHVLQMNVLQVSLHVQTFFGAGGQSLLTCCKSFFACGWSLLTCCEDSCVSVGVLLVFFGMLLVSFKML